MLGLEALSQVATNSAPEHGASSSSQFRGSESGAGCRVPPGAQGRLALPVPGRSQSPAVAGLRPRGPCCPPAGASQLLQAACIPGLTAPPPSRKLRSLLLRPHVAGWKTPAALRAREAGSGPPGALWRQGRNDGVLPGVGRALSPWFRGCRCRASRGCCHVPVSCRGTCPAGKPGGRAVVIFLSSTPVPRLDSSPAR